LSGEKKLAKHNLPKSRPNDYFAEMVKTDGTAIPLRPDGAS